MHRNNNEVSFHFAVDDKEIIQGLPLNRNSWNAGDGGSGKGNRKGISIEICYSKSGGKKFETAQKNAAELTAKLLKDYGWGIDKVKKHQDFNGKYCPHRTLSDYGWEYFLNLVKGYMTPKTTIKKGSLVSIKSGATYYNGKKVPSWVLKDKWYVAEIKSNRAVINKNESGSSAINSPIDVKYLSIATKTAKPTIKVGSTVKLNKGAKTYDGKKLSSFVYGRKHKVKELKGNRAVITFLGITVAAVNVKDLTLA
jgi:N-acetylmuramoyl-L-alanine amidase CwlA